jgi:hypothetical protein
MVHRFEQLQNRDQTPSLQVPPIADDRQALRKRLVVVSLRGSKRVLLEERNDYASQLFEPADVVSVQILLVVVGPPIAVQLPHSEELP